MHTRIAHGHLVDKSGRAVAVPVRDRMKQGAQTWDGIKIPPPANLDLGDVRFSLGFLHWKNDDPGRCVKALAPFLSDAKLAGSKSRAQALFMAGQSSFKLFDYAGAAAALRALVRDYPRFEAIEEAYVWAARAYAETRAWADLELLCKTFVNEWPKSDRRTRIDLFAALAAAGQGRADAARATLKNIAASDTYEDVKADAYYHLAMMTVAANPSAAMGLFENSLAFPRDASLLEAGKCAARLKQWEKAKSHLERVGREKGDPKYLAEAKELLAVVQKELVKK